MIVGLITWELHLDACHSLKEKRHILKSLKDRLHQRFNVSAAETDHHDLWQRAELSAAVVSTDRHHAEQVLREADRLVEGADGARIVDSSTVRVNNTDVLTKENAQIPDYSEKTAIRLEAYMIPASSSTTATPPAATAPAMLPTENC